MALPPFKAKMSIVSPENDVLHRVVLVAFEFAPLRYVLRADDHSLVNPQLRRFAPLYRARPLPITILPLFLLSTFFQLRGLDLRPGLLPF